jgi:hypothetical protein
MHYLEKDEIDEKAGKSLSGSWKAPAFSQSFQNVEVKYRVIGSTEIRTYRHVAWNLSDSYLKKHDAVLKHLDHKGKITILAKGGSNLLWYDEFSMFRQYLIDHIGWMISDSTGVAPMFLPATLEQEAYGRFVGPTKELEKTEGMKADLSFRKLWSKPKDKMPFRFGYLDKDNSNHLVITRPKP